MLCHITNNRCFSTEQCRIRTVKIAASCLAQESCNRALCPYPHMLQGLQRMLRMFSRRRPAFTSLAEGIVVHDANDFEEARQAQDVQAPPAQDQVQRQRGK